MKTSSVCLLTLAAGAVAVAAPFPADAAHPAQVEYVAHLHAMNTGVTKAKTQGEARFTIDGDKLKIRIDVRAAPPGVVHWQHFHGFKDGHAAACSTMAEDANHDGIVDLIETGKTAGTTMVPFDSDPVSMDVAHGTYPTADAHGNYHYVETVSLKALDAAFNKTFPGQKLDLDKRVVMIHGVPSDTKLPGTVASLGPIPAHVTLPIACGRIERITAHPAR